MAKEFSYTFYKTTTEAWDAMYQALYCAQKSILWEVYILIDDEAGNRFIDVLCEKARTGIETKIILDAVGSFVLTKTAEKKLVASGVEVVWYNRLYPEWSISKWFSRLWVRNHRKILIIDEGLAFVGGVNVELPSQSWDDLHVRLQGRIVRPLLRAFAKSYIRSGGAWHKVKQFLHPHLTQGLQELRTGINFIRHSPGFPLQQSSIRKFYLRSLAMAKKSFTLLTPYYVPDKKFLQLIYRARKRGVKVSILLPLRPDHKFLEYMAQTFYSLTQAAGAEVYLLPRMNHGKALCVDNSLGLVGSINFTPRSFSANEEAGVYFTDKAMIEDLNSILDEWKSGAQLATGLGSSIKKWPQRFLGWMSGFLKDYV